MIAIMAENQPPTAPNGNANNAEDRSKLEAVASLLYAATSVASALPFGVDQSYLAVGLELAHADALAMLPAGSKHSPSSYADREAMLFRAAETAAANPTTPAVGVAVLLREALEIVAGVSPTPESRELASKLTNLQQDAESARIPPSV